MTSLRKHFDFIRKHFWGGPCSAAAGKFRQILRGKDMELFFELCTNADALQGEALALEVNLDFGTLIYATPPGCYKVGDSGITNQLQLQRKSRRSVSVRTGGGATFCAVVPVIVAIGGMARESVAERGRSE